MKAVSKTKGEDDKAKEDEKAEPAKKPAPKPAAAKKIEKPKP